MESIQIDQMSTDVKSDHRRRQASPDRATVKQLPTQKEVQTWIVNYVAELLEVNPNRIDVTIPFDRYGLDSSAAVGLAGDLEDWLKRELDPTLLYDYPTIKTLSQHIVGSLSN